MWNWFKEDKKNGHVKIKKAIWYVKLTLLIGFIIVVLFIDTSEFLMKTFLPSGSEYNNLYHLFFVLQIPYLIFLLFYTKMEFIFYVINLFQNIFVDSFIYTINKGLYGMIKFMYLQGYSDLSKFYGIKIATDIFDLNVFTRRYFDYGFFKEIFFRGDNPIFFYFGLLFILTTIFSVFLLSYFGFYGVFILNLITIIMFWFSTIAYFNMFYIDDNTYKINLGKWFVASVNQIVYFEIFIDSTAYSFMFLTLTIAVFVYIYTFSYFRYEPNVERLILLINSFVISMICLVTSGNFFVLFLGWELIGLTSFFLINFWSTRISTLKAGFKAFVFNKYSDASLLIAIMIIFLLLAEINIPSFNSQVSIYNHYYINTTNYNIPIIELISFFLVICAFIKSAQFGFHVWLPDSMEAPVPASALIHSATLVSAGVFLLLRLSPMFEYSLYSYYIVPLIGSFTAFFGGLCSIYQSDIKRILAYSTISHCGFLMICYSIYIPEYTVLYLYIHGFFKAAVFLCVGNIIRFSRNYQDFRKMGQFWTYLPFECFASFVCLINLCGLPFTLGFYIKHLLLIGIYMDNYMLYFILVNILGGAVAGLLYSFRLFYYVFFDFKKSKKIIYNQSNRYVLKSEWYTNTTLASNIAIFGLIVSAYIICIYMFNIFLNSSSLGDGLNIYSIHASQYEEFNHPILTTINNISYFNWVLMIIILSILLYPWRKVNKYYNVINFFSSYIIFNIFIYIFYIIL